MEESAKGKASVVAVLPAALLVMLTILIFQLKSFQRVFLVLSVAPLGVVVALMIAQAPPGFVAILGILALVGMIARNSVILIDQIETEIAAGQTPWDAVVNTAINRTRPILLTASAATLGMIRLFLAPGLERLTAMPRTGVWRTRGCHGAALPKNTRIPERPYRRTRPNTLSRSRSTAGLDIRSDKNPL